MSGLPQKDNAIKTVAPSGDLCYTASMSMLTKAEIEGLIKNRKPPLVESLIELSEQLQPNGIDLTLRDIARISSPGQIGAANADRVISKTDPLSFDESGLITLAPGCYIITYNEVVNMPEDIAALGRPRSSLLRCGVNVGTAVWDAGYCGRSQSLLVVYNPAGFKVQRNARVMQLVFFKLSGKTRGYDGKYQYESIAHG
jgi:dUTP pyrophosphatase